MRFLTGVKPWFQGDFRTLPHGDAELKFHIEAYVEDLVGSGVPCQEAMRQARLEFGGIERAKEECREARGETLVVSLIQVVRYGLRMLRKSPAFRAVAH